MVLLANTDTTILQKNYYWRNHGKCLVSFDFQSETLSTASSISETICGWGSWLINLQRSLTSTNILYIIGVSFSSKSFGTKPKVSPHIGPKQLQNLRRKLDGNQARSKCCLKQKGQHQKLQLASWLYFTSDVILTCFPQFVVRSLT